mmetsp:Transcript_125437/g.360451  ORF Transcript_125437/g.360451 Transcript_125437/m.360451 type:complete len:236 (+) Transcript_125437:1215-1922(+)
MGQCANGHRVRSQYLGGEDAHVGENRWLVAEHVHELPTRQEAPVEKGIEGGPPDFGRWILVAQQAPDEQNQCKVRVRIARVQHPPRLFEAPHLRVGILRPPDDLLQLCRTQHALRIQREERRAAHIGRAVGHGRLRQSADGHGVRGQGLRGEPANIGEGRRFVAEHVYELPALQEALVEEGIESRLSDLRRLIFAQRAAQNADGFGHSTVVPDLVVPIDDVAEDAGSAAPVRFGP